MSIRVLNITIIVFIISLISCSQEKNPQFVRLERLAECSSDSAVVALDTLNMLNPDSLSDIDRHYYDFLTIKISDKSFITHTSDSLILKVIDYAVKHGDKEHYAETLYYGGRVYSDLGDYPRALRYFQQALDELPEKNVNIDLKCRILSQIGGLLNGLRLYREAAPYLEANLKYSSIDSDSIGIVKDLQLLGAIYLHSYDYIRADSCFVSAIMRSRYFPIHYIALSNMYRAKIKERSGDIDSAIILIDKVPFMVNRISRNTALAYAADIYLKAGVLDSAYRYAYRLINSKDPANRQIGYEVMFSPELYNRINSDTLLQYSLDYRRTIENYFDNNENQLALQQQAKYNYEIHERDKVRAEQRVNELTIIIFVISIILLVSIIITLIFRNRNQRNLIKLHEALQKIEKLRKSIDGENNDSSQYQVIDSSNVQQVREKLKKELFDFLQKKNNQISVAPDILNSAEYRKLELFISEEKVIPESSAIWSDLEEAVIKAYPHFKYRLQLLIGNNPSDGEYRLIILMKFGLTFSQIATLLGRRQSTITYRREKLCHKIFGYKTKLSDVDALIIAL